MSRYGKVKPVVLQTRDGGKSWTNTAAGIKDFECGEWGWKIQFLNATHGFVSLENFRNASILVTTDGGKSWVKKHVAKDQNPSSPVLNNDLEGIGFINEREGWVGGWGFPLSDTDPFGGYQNTYTADGGETWVAQNNPPDPRFRINRYRFVKDIDGTVTSGFCSGQQVYKLTGKKKGAFAARTHGLTASAPRSSLPTRRRRRRTLTGRRKARSPRTLTRRRKGRLLCTRTERRKGRSPRTRTDRPPRRIGRRTCPRRSREPSSRTTAST